MTLAQWTRQIVQELTAAGFPVSEFEGFPFVDAEKLRAGGGSEVKRFIDFKFSLAVQVRLYSEGAIVTPAGAAILAQAIRGRDAHG